MQQSCSTSILIGHICQVDGLAWLMSLTHYLLWICVLLTFFGDLINQQFYYTGHRVWTRIGLKEKENKPQYTECPDHGTAWHQGSSSLHMLQWCLGSHMASSYPGPPNQEMPKVNLKSHMQCNANKKNMKWKSQTRNERGRLVQHNHSYPKPLYKWVFHCLERFQTHNPILRLQAYGKVEKVRDHYSKGMGANSCDTETGNSPFFS